MWTIIKVKTSRDNKIRSTSTLFWDLPLGSLPSPFGDNWVWGGRRESSDDSRSRWGKVTILKCTRACHSSNKNFPQEKLFCQNLLEFYQSLAEHGEKELSNSSLLSAILSHLMMGLEEKGAHQGTNRECLWSSHPHDRDSLKD